MENKQWPYRIRPSRPGMLEASPTQEEEALFGQHFEYLKDLASKDAETARVIFENDPTMKAGVFEGDPYPFTVTLKSEG